MKEKGNIFDAIYIWMTIKDLKDFSQDILNQFEDISFVDVIPIKSPDRREYSDIAESYKSADPRNTISIVNNNICSRKLFDSYTYEIKEYYHFAGIGNGLIQFALPKQSKMYPNCLEGGTLSYSYDETDKEAELFVKKILKLVRSKSFKVYAVTADKQVVEKPSRKCYAWADAAKIYNGDNDKYLSYLRDIAIAKC